VTDGQADGIAVASTALAKRRAVKIWCFTLLNDKARSRGNNDRLIAAVQQTV